MPPTGPRVSAHAGVWTVLSLLLQIFLDSARLSASAKWLARICAPLAAVFLSAGFFGVSVSIGFRWLIYLGVVSMLIALLLTVLGLVRDLRVGAEMASELRRR